MKCTKEYLEWMFSAELNEIMSTMGTLVVNTADQNVDFRVNFINLIRNHLDLGKAN